MSDCQALAARKFRAAFLLIALSWLLVPAEARTEIRLLGVATIPADASDQSGLPETLVGGVPQNRLAGFSGIEYSGHANRYFVLPDRGPLDGAVPFPCRLQEFEIVIELNSPTPVRATLVGTNQLKTERGEQLVGSAAAFDSRDPTRSLRFDPEAVRRFGENRLIISDEYGPSLSVFDPAHSRTSQLPVPEKFCVKHLAATPSDELAGNSTGRQPNAGFEGIAINPSGETLYAMVQRPLIQDSQSGVGDKRIGVNCRVLELNLKTSATRELVYRLDNSKTGVSELLAVGPRQLLVIERDSELGDAARSKKIYKVNLSDTTDCSQIASLSADELPNDVRPIQKQLFLDFLEPRWGLAGPNCPEKFEGLAFGPTLPDGRRLLIVTVDNDFKPNAPSLILAFAVDPDDLPEFGWDRRASSAGGRK